VVFAVMMVLTHKPGAGYVRGYVGMYWVWRESTQVHREGGTVSSKGNEKCSVCYYDGTSSQGAGYVRGCSGRPRVETQWVMR